MQRKVGTASRAQVALDISDLYSPRSISKLQDELVSDHLKNSLGTASPSQGRAAANQVAKDFTSKKLYKNISPRSLSKGQISPVENMRSDYDMTRFSTGDAYYKEIKVLSSFKIGASSSRVSRSSVGYPVIRTKLTGPAALKFIDYFIFTATKNSRSIVCGVAHNDTSGQISFIDYTSKDFVGNVEYFITPVLLDGTYLDRITVTKIVLNEMFPSRNNMSK